MNSRIKESSCLVKAGVVTLLALIGSASLTDIAIAQADDQPPEVESIPDPNDLANPITFDEPNTPRASLAIFVDSAEQELFAPAAALLDYSSLPTPPSEFQQARLVIRLKEVIDGLPIVDPTRIQNTPDGEVYLFPPGVDDAPIELRRMDDGRWLFSTTTVANLDQLHARYANQRKPEPEPESQPTSDRPDEGEPAETTAEPEEEVPDELRSARRTMRTLLDKLDAANSSRRL